MVEGGEGMLTHASSAQNPDSGVRNACSEELFSLVLVGHGDRGAGLTNRNLIAHTETLRAAGRFRSVHCGVLKGDPSLEAAISEASRYGAAPLCIYPFFMADGYFTGKVLPERIAAARPRIAWHMLPPLGLDRRLASLIRDDAIWTRARSGIPPASARLLIVGHGSKLGPASANATRSMAAEVERFGAFREVATAFLEEAPLLVDALKANSEGPTIVTGFFSGDGMHAGEDVPEAIAATGANAVYAGPIGANPKVGQLILESATA